MHAGDKRQQFTETLIKTTFTPVIIPSQLQYHRPALSVAAEDCIFMLMAIAWKHDNADF